MRDPIFNPKSYKGEVWLGFCICIYREDKFKMLCRDRKGRLEFIDPYLAMAPEMLYPIGRWGRNCKIFFPSKELADKFIDSLEKEDMDGWKLVSAPYPYCFQDCYYR